MLKYHIKVGKTNKTQKLKFPRKTQIIKILNTEQNIPTQTSNSVCSKNFRTTLFFAVNDHVICIFLFYYVQRSSCNKMN